MPEFVSEWKHFKLSDEDLQALEEVFRQSPEAGQVMAGCGGARKLRFAPPSRRSGKSGAYRVIYLYLRIGDRIVLLTMFAKNDQANLNAAQKAYFKKVAGLFKP